MIARPSLKQQIANGATLVGPFCKLPAPQLMEIFGFAGFDFTIIDCEHGPLTFESVENLVRAAEVSGIAPLVRVPQNEPSMIDRALDVGAAGVLVPHISSKQEAEKLAEAARYAPEGERGVCRYVRAAKFSKTDRYEYFKTANQNVVVIAMIEGISGINNLAEILSVKGIDVIFVGPYDLSQSLGIPGQVNSPAVEEKMKLIVNQAKQAGVATATFVETPEGVQKWAKLGVQLLSYSTDVGLILQGASETVKAIQEKLKI